ncbi:MAG: ABC transporter permease subunit, partial [Planctomycetes bacterium]|nr:ABC transporter permease subunit [Planctomycetota bacterium]
QASTEDAETPAADREPTLHFKVRRTRYDLMQDREIVSLSGARLPLADLTRDAGASLPAGLPDHLLLTGSGNDVLLLWNDGTLLRIDARDVDAPQLAEVVHLTAAGVDVTAVSFLIGKTTLLVGDARGTVTSWFGTKPDDAAAPDGVRFVAARTFDGTASPVVSITASRRSRLFAFAHQDGHFEVMQGTSAKLVATGETEVEDARSRIVLSPKENGVAVLAGGGLHRFDLDPGHPEVSLASAFMPVWYESSVDATHTWQSTSGSDDFEPKLGLWVLIFGTLKSTLYCLLFSVPLAILAAIYTSEFLTARWRARIKPSIELMASLPSVVLGFLAALVFAPYVADYLVAALCAVICVPAVFLLGAQLWQIMPRHLQISAESWRLTGTVLAFPLGIALALACGPVIESLMFDGDFKDWLALGMNGTGDQRGSAFGGWFLAMMPLAALLAFVLTGRVFGGLAGRVAGLSRFGIGAGLTLAIAVLASFAMSAAGLDLRGSLFGIYDPRNSLVVGFVMGFAVVPIIYTIAEDALSAVPEHLRAASLGAGATPWQTAVRIVLPTAMSGVFSAVMVGFGRAVGETMIVVMATGSTPILDLNAFNGFRTLSACIAIELPEAVRDSTHYRMLYLAALCLFVMTFALNTVAEMVRQRFRKRAYQL